METAYMDLCRISISGLYKISINQNWTKWLKILRISICTNITNRTNHQMVYG